MSRRRGPRVEFTFADPNAEIAWRDSPGVRAAATYTRDRQALREKGLLDSAPMRDNLVITETSPTCYISGIVALNIPCDAGTGDWHEDSVLFAPRVRIPRSFIIERSQDFDPSALLGDVGIYDAAPALDKLGVKHPPGPVLAATHTRAIADMVLVSVLRGESTAHVSQIDDWLHTPAQMQEAVSIVESAIPQLSPEQTQSLEPWIKSVQSDIETLSA